MEYGMHRRRHSCVLSWIYDILIIKASLAAVCGTCTFPSDLIGQWSRGRDNKALTFTSSQVTGLGIPYFATTLDTFICDFNTDDNYVISASYTSLAPENRTYFACWHLEEITSSAFIFYELTDDLSEAGFSPAQPGVTGPTGTSTSQATVCTKTVSSTFFTTLIKNGATSSGVTTTCPSSLFATFSYNLCSDSELSFCPDHQTARIDYTKCSTPILNTAQGVLSCMGHVNQSSYTYVNLFNQDPGNGVTCLRVPRSVSVAQMAVYYSGDCSTASGSGTTLTLTSTVTCPIDDDDDDDDTDSDEGDSSASSGVTGAIAGGAVATVIVVCLIVSGVYHYVTKKEKASKIEHGDKNCEAERGNADPNGTPGVYAGPATITSSNFPFPEPHDSPRRLPPIETRDNVPGEPLRK